MDNYYDLKYASNINREDTKTLDNILRKYDFEVLLVEKVRSAYKVYTDNGVYCLKKISNGYNRAKKGYLVARYLKENNFNKLADYKLTKKGCIFIRRDKSTYYITNWIDGREASFKNMDDILTSIRLMAEFHNKSKDFKTNEKIRIKKQYGKWIDIYKNQWKEIREAVKRIKKNSRIDLFDKLFLEGYRIFKKDYRLVKKLLNSNEYEGLVRICSKERTVCHDSFYYQNIIIDKSNNANLIDMESCTIDMPISDLGKSIRRILERSKFKWDFDICKDIIDEYNNVRHLSKEETYILLAFLVFPHKYYRLYKRKYVKNKEWSEEKFVKKLYKLLSQEYLKQLFVKKYLECYEITL